MQNLRVSMVQGATRWHDPAGNRDYYGHLLASLHGLTDLVLLPETFTSGFSNEAIGSAETMDGPTVAWMRDQAVKRYVSQATPADKPQMAEQLRLTAQRALALFAGDEHAPLSAAEKARGDAVEPGGLQALAQFVEASVPEGERARISEVLLRIINGCLVELAQITRQQAGLAPLPATEETSRFMTQAVLSLSDAAFYPAPVLLQLSNFTQVQASVFQLARAPGKNLVYLGAVLLIVGVFTMLYIRERRLWVWLQADGGGGTNLQAALSTTRRTLDLDAEFDQLKTALLPPQAVVVNRSTPSTA